MKTQPTTRRNFLRLSSAASMSLLLPSSVAAKMKGLRKKVSIGVIADLHADIMHDTAERLDVFLKAMEAVKPDALMQLGDFAIPKKQNQPTVDRLNKAHAKVIHVIGNHDTDGGYTQQQCMQFLGLEKPYYSTEVEGLRVIVLDGNEKGSLNHKGGYPAYIGKTQQAWLDQELAKSTAPTVIVSHQALVGPGSVNNAEEIQTLLAKYDDRIILAVNGHVHIDALTMVGKIPYLNINSASYYWVGGKFSHQSYAPEVHSQHKNISSTCPYRDVLFTTLIFDPETNTVQVQGRESKWVGKSPQELGVMDRDGEFSKAVTPQISARAMEV
ncbi:hypothetical protein NT6N_16390 [Oceaniferula spumae]|uniref:Calcineurin-like phosphoesterase domain-containing protein n=1 Tax=Oceaniferula spumae TaxID=2979115 RepID=A0AAT9FKU8_9BACT